MDLVTVMDCPLTFNCSAFVLCEQRCPTGNYLSTVILRAAGSLDFSEGHLATVAVISYKKKSSPPRDNFVLN